VKPGDSFAIIGPNGSGKSTALKLLSRILRPTRGTLAVRGRVGTLIELGAGFHPDLTGRENVYLNGTILGMKRKEIDKKFDAIVDFAELSEFIDTPVKRYSSGMFARLGFSVAAHVNPDVLIVDEVLSVGDYHFQHRCFEKMREFTRNGTSLIFVSHNMTAVSSLCSQALLLRKGVPLYQGDSNLAIQKYHSLYVNDTAKGTAVAVEACLKDSSGLEREVFRPGETLTLEATVTALEDIPPSYPALLVYTADSKFVFDTATSRLLENGSGKLTLKKGERATISFTVDLNLRGGVFLLGFNISQEIDVPGVFIYENSSLKRIVISGDSRSGGVVHLNPRAELRYRTAARIPCAQAV
jgi:lipopolysaccharide transport system ATP-binding protein